MEDLTMVSTVSDGSHGGRLKRLRSQKCGLSSSPYPPKFRSRKVSAARSFPDSLSGFDRNIKQKSNDDHACEQDDCSCAKASEPDMGLACDFEDENVEPVSQGPAMTNAFADEEFVARVETLKHENADTIDSMRIMNRMTVNVKVDDGGYPQLGNKRGGSIMDHMILPKRRKVSAVRDFPDAFRQCNGQNGSQKKAVISFDAVQNDFGEVNGASDFKDKPGPTDTDFAPLRNTAETEFDLLHHDLNLGGQELVYATDKEKVLELAADLVDSEGGGASVTPLATLHVSDWEENAESVIPLAIREHDRAEIISQTDAAEKPELENDKAGENFYGQIEIPKPVKQNMVPGRAYVQLNHMMTSMKMHPAFKIRKVSAVRDFPVAFKSIYAGSKDSSKNALITEEKVGRPDSSLVNKPVTPKISLKQRKVKSFQGQHLESKESEHRIIVQALMAAPRCPWSSKKSQGSNKRKLTGKKGMQKCRGIARR